MINWTQVEETTGHKIVFASLNGPRRYGLESDASDANYSVFVIPEKDANTYSPRGHYKLSEQTDYFFENVGNNPSLALFANIWNIPAYGSVVYADIAISSFLEIRQTELSNISPYRTFYITKREIQTRFEEIEQAISPADIYTRLAMISRMAGTIYNFIQTGNFADSFYLDGEFLAAYRRAKAQDPSLTVDKVKALVAFINSPQTLMFFNEYQSNLELYAEFLNKIKEVS